MSAVSVLPATSALGPTTLGDTSASQSQSTGSFAQTVLSLVGRTLKETQDNLGWAAHHHASQATQLYWEQIQAARHKLGFSKDTLTGTQRTNLDAHDQNALQKTYNESFQSATITMLKSLSSLFSGFGQKSPSQTKTVTGADLFPSAAEKKNALDAFFPTETHPNATGDLKYSLSFARHEQGNNNTNPMGCEDDAPLTAFGAKNAAEAGDAIRESILRGETDAPTVIFASPLERTFQTATQLARGVFEATGVKPTMLMAPWAHEEAGCCGSSVNPGKDFSEAEKYARIGYMGPEGLLSEHDYFNDGSERHGGLLSKRAGDIQSWLSETALELHRRTGKSDINILTVAHANLLKEVEEALTGKAATAYTGRYMNGQRKTFTMDTKNWQDAQEHFERSTQGNYLHSYLTQPSATMIGHAMRNSRQGAMKP